MILCGPALGTPEETRQVLNVALFKRGLSTLIKPPSPGERRKLLRMSCRYSVTVDGAPATMVDVGLGGVGLENAGGLSVGQLVTVSLADSHVRCRVVWVRRPRFLGTARAGLQFEDTPDNLKNSWVPRLLRDLGVNTGRITRRRLRIRVPAGRLRASLTPWPGDVSLPATAVNLGLGGALVECDQTLPMGQHVVVRLGPLEELEPLYCRGEVISRREKNYNLKFVPAAGQDLTLRLTYYRRLSQAD